MTTRIYQGAPGVASFESDDGFSQVELLIGDIPPNGAPLDCAVAQNSNFPLFCVVGRVGNVATGALAKATADGTVKAIGVLMVPVVTGSGVTTTARVHRSGHFNANALQWDASFDTLAKKVAAFEGSSTPTNILIGINPYDKPAT